MATNFNSTVHFSKFNGSDISEPHAKNLIVAADSDTVRVGVGAAVLGKVHSEDGHGGPVVI